MVKTVKSAKKSKYHDEVQQFIKYIGGAQNVASAYHCVSRVRLVVKDMKLVDDKAIEKLPSSRGVIKLPGNQFHTIIGVDVPEYFKEFSAQTGITASSKEDAKSEAAKNSGWLQKMMQSFSEIFIPIIPVLVAAGLILGLRNILEANFDGYKIIGKEATVDHGYPAAFVKLIPEEKVWVGGVPFLRGVYDFLWIPAQAGLWFLPVYICWSIFRKMGGTPTLGIFIGLTMLIDPLKNIYNISGQSDKSIKWIWELNLKEFGFNFGDYSYPYKISYTAQVIPAIGVGFVGVYIERGLTKIITPVLRQIFVPLLVVLGAYIVGMMAIGPIGHIIGTAIAFAVQWSLTNNIARYFFGPIFGLLYAPLVVTGLHHMMNAVMTIEAGNGGTVFFPILCMSNIAQGTAALAFGLIHRKKAKTGQVAYSATASAYLGVTEPAMYGINIKYLSPFFAAIFGSAMGSLVLVVSGVSAAAIGNGAWLGVLSMQAESGVPGLNNFANQAGYGYTWFIIAGLVTAGVTAAGTFFARKIPRVKRYEEKIGVL